MFLTILTASLQVEVNALKDKVAAMRRGIDQDILSYDIRVSRAVQRLTRATFGDEAIRTTPVPPAFWTYTARDEGARAWILTDSARKNAVGRRLDGNVWQSTGRKSKTLSGAWGNWPIGIMEAGDHPTIGLAEGAPDFLSVIAHAWASGVEHLVAPVCLAGAAMWIPESVLPRFKGKRVRIFIHNDQAGITAANRWSAQLREAGAVVDGYSFDGLIQTDGRPVEDLNDFCRLDYECLQQQRSAVESVMGFAMPRDFQDHGR